MFIDLSSHHNLAVGLFSKQSTLVIALLCGTLRKNIFATATKFNTQFIGREKKQTQTHGTQKT